MAMGAADDINKINIALAVKDKGIATFAALVNTALAITKALSGSIPPFNFIAAAAVAAAGYAQVQAIRAQKFAKGGLVDRPTLGLIGEAGPEIVAPQRDFLDVVNSLVRGGSIKSQESRKQLSAAREIRNLELRAEIDAETLSIIVESGDKSKNARTY